MNTAALVMFWAMAIAMALFFIGYPLLLVILPKGHGQLGLKPSKPPMSPAQPAKVSLIIAARNAGSMVEEKLKNSFQLLHPTHLLEVVLVSDGSDDDTIERARSYPDKRIVTAALPEHLGKNAALNKAARIASGDVLLFTDMDARLNADALKLLLSHFDAPSVGGVCGRRIVGTDASHAAEGQRRYANLDSALKKLESQFGALSSNDGKIFAIRRKLFTPVPDAVTDDLFQGLSIIAKGYSFVYEPLALACIPTPSRSAAHEVTRRRRIVTGSLRCLYLLRRLFNPFRFGFFSFGLWVNKVLRRLLPFILGVFFAASLVLRDAGSFYRLALTAQVAGFVLAALHPMLMHSPLRSSRLEKFASMGFYFLVGNWGTLLGVLDFLLGRRVAKWTPRKQDNDALPNTPNYECMKHFEAQDEPAEHRVAYVVTRFPRITETFVLYEFLEVQKFGLRAELHPLILEMQELMHEEARKILPYVRYTPVFSMHVLRDTLFCLTRHWPASRKLLREIWIDLHHSPRLMLKTLGILPKCFSIALQLRRGGISHVHAHFATYPATCAYVAHRITGISYSFTAHAHDIFLDTGMLARKLRGAAFAVMISRFNMAYLAARLGPEVLERMLLIRCGVDSGFFTPPETPRSNEGPCRIACVASFKDMKGHVHLIEACALLKSRGIDFLCLLVGDGPLQAQSEAHVARLDLEGVVRFLGNLTREEVREFWRQADIATLPAVQGRRGDMDGVPVALMEAMACCLPVVCTEISGLPELVAHGVSGIVAPPGDANALAEALERLCKDPELRRAMGHEGRRIVENEFDLHRNAANLAQKLREAAERSQRL